MAISPDLDRQIEQEMAGLIEEDYLRPGMSYNDFVGEFSKLLAQAKEDESILMETGLDVSVLPKYYAYLEKLSLEHGERVNAEAERSQAQEEFDLQMPEARNEKKLLMAVGRYITTRTEKHEDKKVYDMVRKGHGDVDTLNDNITMVNFLRSHKDLAQEVRPGGKVVNDEYLNRVEQNALNLLKLRGVALTAGDDTMEQVDRQNRLLTLCIKAQREIKLFAEMAFYADRDRYNQFYASDELRRQRSDRQEETPETPL